MPPDSTDALVKISGAEMPWVTQNADFSPEASALQPAAMASASIALDELRRHGLLEDALRLMAFSLPPREAVWWACSCWRLLLTDPEARQQDEAALLAAEAWVYEPQQERADEAAAIAQALDHQTPGAWCAVAAHWSSDSLAPAHLPAVKPPAHLTGKAVLGAVLLARLHVPDEQAVAADQQLIDIARDIAAGGDGRSFMEEPQ